ncbi:MAG: hypothetical protein IKG99_06055 [Bacteroidaceae bacterium]|nr:hypothetical protein [Bacteroidaceae bacterium]
MMRNKLIALLLMMTLSLSITAQKTISNNEKVYIPMLSDGNSWKYHFMVDYQEKLMDEWFLYSISSTFTKNGETYYKMYVFLSTNDVNAKTSVSTKSSLFPTLNLREKDRKVLVDRKEYLAFLEGENGYNIPIFGDKNYLPYPVTSDDEIVLYDFNMNVGDKFISVEGHEDISVVKVDTIESFENRPSDKSLPRKWITLSNGMVIVEGVGCINSAGGLLSYLNPLQDTEEQSMNVVSGEIDYTYLNVDNSEDERDDYKPFVEIGYSYEPCKRWRVIHTMPGEMTHSTFTHSWLSDNYYFDNYQLENEKTVRGDNTYFNMKCYGSGPVKGHLRMPDPSRENVLLREKDRKVYVYSEKDQKEYLLYDFSLKEGDAFTSYDIDAGETVNLKVLSVGQLDDGPRVFPYNKTSEDGKEEEKRPLKTWTIGIEIESDVYPAEYQEIFTLIEGVGCNEGPFFNYDKSKGCDYLAFVIGPESYCAYPLIFPFFNTQYASVRGCKMLTGDEVSHNWDGGNELTCELVDGALHVYGNVWLSCASDYYAYFMEEPTDDSMVHILRFYSDVSSLYVATCQGMYQTNFWVPGFGPGDMENAPEGYDPSKIEYIVVDEYGNEYPVIKKNKEDDIFQVGRKWIVIDSFYNPSKVYSLTGYKCEGQEVVDGLLCNVLSYYSMSDFENPFEMDDDVLFSIDNLKSIHSKYVYRNGSRYYQHNPNKGHVDKLLFNFAVSQGDTISLFPHYPELLNVEELSSLVTAVGDTILEDSSDKRVRKWVSVCEYDDGGGSQDIWIEGIGSLRGGPDGSLFSFSGGHVLFKCYDDDNIYYINKNIPWQNEFVPSQPFVEQNKEWKVRWSVVGPYESTHWNSQKYIISGDTVISGRRCSKMYSDDLFYGVKGKYILSLYEENGKVYFIPKNSEEEHLLYDFSANVGDIVYARGITTKGWNGSDIKFVVWKTEVREIEGVKRKCLLVVPKEDDDTIIDDRTAESWGEWWIDGIGTEENPIEHYTPDFEGAVSFLEYCKNGDGLFLYHHAYTPPVCMVDRNMSWIQEYAESDGNSAISDIEKQHVFFKSSTIEGDDYIMTYPIGDDDENSLYMPLYASALGDEENAHIVAALREEDGKVYIWPWKPIQLSFLLYDFSANVGDVMEIIGVPVSNRYEDSETIPELYSAKCRIEKVEEREIEGVRRRCLYVQEVLPNEDFSVSPTYDDIWIEGIGSVRGILGNVSFKMDGKAPYMKLLECSWYDEIYYRADDHPRFASSRPFIEENKVWKVGITDHISNDRFDMIEYLYFDGDTIIDGKTCKRMMVQEYAKEGSYAYDAYYHKDAPLRYIGAWYEDNQKVYFAAPDQQLHLTYDFSVSKDDTFSVFADGSYQKFKLFSKSVGEIEGFKGIWYIVGKDYLTESDEMTTHLFVWLEGVGSQKRPDYNVELLESGDHPYMLMSCTVGDEVIYLNDSYEDGVSPDANVPKRRIDFTHTVKVKPKAPVRKNTDETENTLTGDYSDRLLNIDLGKLNSDYSMVIKNQSDSVVYVKSVRANEIVALNIDISDYDGGDYTINIENSDEVFSGVFTIVPTAIHEIASDSKENGQQMKEVIYDLTGRPMSKDRLSRGIYIQNGKKVLVR